MDVISMVDIPSEVRRAIKTLHDDTRFNILITLSETGEMSFSQLEDVIRISSSNLTYHLRALREGALIENFFKRIENVDSHSFYRVTPFGERLIDSLFRVFSPGPILVEYKRTHEIETIRRETWTEEIKFRTLPQGQKYREIVVESSSA